LFIFCCVVFIQEEQVKSWSDTYKLTWNDFKGVSQNNKRAAAITASGITFGFSIKTSGSQVINFTTEVYAHFYPEESWYKPELADSYILAHEQLHFDITELHARKFRQKIAQLKASNHVESDLKSLHKNSNRVLENMQVRYDKETNYSRNSEFQNKWKSYIDVELKTLSKYKSL
jgi:hypothetical protein